MEKKEKRKKGIIKLFLTVLLAIILVVIAIAWIENQTPKKQEKDILKEEGIASSSDENALKEQEESSNNNQSPSKNENTSSSQSILSSKEPYLNPDVHVFIIEEDIGKTYTYNGSVCRLDSFDYYITEIEGNSYLFTFNYTYKATLLSIANNTNACKFIINLYSPFTLDSPVNPQPMEEFGPSLGVVSAARVSYLHDLKINEQKEGSGAFEFFLDPNITIHITD